MIIEQIVKVDTDTGDLMEYTGELVRCKDCINREKTPLSVCISVESAKHSFFCKLTDMVVTEQFYCGDGERETNDN